MEPIKAESLDNGVFTKFSLKDLVKDTKGIVIVNDHDTIEMVLNVLGKEKLQCCPVIETKTRKFIGMISTADIVSKVLLEPLFGGSGETKEKISKEKLTKLLCQTNLKKPISSILSRSVPAMFAETDKMPVVLSAFSSGNHRGLVLRREGKKPEDDAYIFTQTDCANFIRDRIRDEVAKFGGGSLVAAISKLPINIMKKIEQRNKDLVTVRASDSALSGFAKLMKHKVRKDWNLGAIPVIADGGKDEGKIVATLSASDLRSLTQDEVPFLLRPVTDYLKYIYGKIPTPLSVSAETTFGEALNKILDNKVHRVWVADGKGSPTGVFALTDAIYQFTSEASKAQNGG